jgi:hypothetical protein
LVEGSQQVNHCINHLDYHCILHDPPGNLPVSLHPHPFACPNYYQHLRSQPDPFSTGNAYLYPATFNNPNHHQYFISHSKPHGYLHGNIDDCSNRNTHASTIGNTNLYNSVLDNFDPIPEFDPHANQDTHKNCANNLHSTCYLNQFTHYHINTHANRHYYHPRWDIFTHFDHESHQH